MKPNRLLSERQFTFSLAAMAGGTAAILAAMGRVWWCEAGDYWPWSFDIWSQHNSQHIIDPYAISHVEHGIALFLILTLCAGRHLSVQLRTLIVAAIESLWEIVENTPMMINRYREATISLDYFGDSIINSLSDFGMCLLGVLIANKLTWKTAIAVFVIMELVSLIWIRDSLLINIIMLVSPVDSIKEWQSQLAPT